MTDKPEYIDIDPKNAEVDVAIPPDLQIAHEQMLVKMAQDGAAEAIDVSLDLLGKVASLTGQLLAHNAAIQGLLRRTAEDHKKIHVLEQRIIQLEGKNKNG